MEYKKISDKGQKVSQALGRLQMSAVCDDARSVSEVIDLAKPIMDEIEFVENLRKYKESVLVLVRELAESVEEIELAEKVM